MGFLDPKVDQQEFDQFQSNILAQLASLQSEIRSRASDSEESARLAAEQANASATRTKELVGVIEVSLREIDTYKANVADDLHTIAVQKNEVTAKNAELFEAIERTQNLETQILEAQETVDDAVKLVSGNLESVNTYLDQSKDLPESVSKTQELLEQCNAVFDKIGGILDHSVKKKSEIDDLYKAVYGEDVQGSDGSSEHLEGLKDRLEKSYKAVSEKTNQLESTIKRSVELVTQKHDVLLAEHRDKFEKLVVESDAEFHSVSEQLASLLPGAMAAGLSSAYEKKKDGEETSLQKFEKSFKFAIAGLVGISAIPLCVDIYLLAIQGKDLVQVIKDTPSLIVAILPLYFPILWLAYSTNKKVNLSKRLIEEYTHKSVLGKTFSGLSNQIDSLPSHLGAVKEDLRTRLLYNVLQVSAENPGKLITDYNKADHPLMEALEKSSKLTEAVEALGKIPGLSALAKKLADKSEALLEIQAKKVATGLAMNDSSGAPEEKATA